MMEYSKDGLHLTERFEGCRLVAYPDPGSGGNPWTIGYGHTGPEVVEGLEITQEQAEQCLAQDIKQAEANVNAVVHVELTQEEFDALVDFAFNCGCRNLDSSTLMKKLNAGDYEGASQEFIKWDMAAGHHMAGLLKRREAEAAMFISKLA
jgi:lysozyme